MTTISDSITLWKVMAEQKQNYVSKQHLLEKHHQAV